MEKDYQMVKEYLDEYQKQSLISSEELVDKTIAVNSEACLGLCCHECGACCRSSC